MSNKLIGRDREVRQLKGALTSSKAELIAITGRRRVGKTFVVQQVYAKDMVFELTGIKNNKGSIQLKNFAFALKYYGFVQELESPRTWMDAFIKLIEVLEAKSYKKKYVIFLDELPWLAAKRADFLSGLSFFWNTWASKQNLVIVISGSAASWMIAKVINNRGELHNRVTQLIKMEPFSLKEVEHFLKEKNINYPRYQLLQLYMVTGGIPLYLEYLDKSLSPVENINKMCFEKSGFLRDEFDNLYAALFNNFGNHIEIVRALGKKWKGLSRDEIIAMTSMKNGGTFTKYLRELILSGFVESYSVYGKKKRLTLYRLKDAYTLFYLSFIEPNYTNPLANFSKIASTQQYRSWSGYSFENVCLSHPKQITEALGIEGVATKLSSFDSKPIDGLPGTQIDMIIEREDKSVHICEIKFYNEKIVLNKSDVEGFRMKKTVFRHHSKYKHHIFLTLITTFGMIDNKYAKEGVDQLVLMDALFNK